MDKISIIYKSVNDVRPYENNPRRNENAIEKVKASIDRFGFKVPIVIDAKGVIVSGHTRLEAAKELGLEEVPTIQATDLTEEQVKAFRIADNRVAEDSEWDYFKLAEEVAEIKDLDIDFDLDDLGFDDIELEGILELGGGSNNNDPYDYDDEPSGASTYSPELNPVKDSREVTKGQIDKEQGMQVERVGAARVDRTDTIVCPHCKKEFEVR